MSRRRLVPFIACFPNGVQGVRDIFDEPGNCATPASEAAAIRMWQLRHPGEELPVIPDRWEPRQEDEHQLPDDEVVALDEPFTASKD